MQDETERDLYKELGLQPPTHLRHLTEDELREALKIKTEHHWRQEGNLLLCKCELGSHSSTISVDYMLQGTDGDGKPILKKIAV